jgi:hypothetical protein
VRAVKFHFVILALIACIGAAAQQPRGLKPRAAAGEYPASHQEENAIFAADQLSQTQMEHSLYPELYGRYVVVEVGVFPQAGQTVNLWPEDFVLKNESNGQMLRAVDPSTVARVMQKEPPRKQANVAPYGDVGYSSTRVDPNGNRTGGWHGGAGSSVWIDKNPSGTTSDDRADLENELRDKELPVGDTTEPVAGYLYFPMASKVKKQATYILQYSRNGQIFTLQLKKPPANK